MADFRLAIKLQCLDCPTMFDGTALSPDALIVATEFLTNHVHYQPVNLAVGEDENNG